MKTFQVKDKTFSRIFSQYCNLEEGPWIAGGCARKVWEGKSWQTQDVDFFFRTPDQFATMVNRIAEFGSMENKYETKNAITYSIYIGPNINPSIWNLDTLADVSEEHSKAKNNLTIQLIQKRWYQTAWQLITDFDLGLSQFVTDGKVILTTDQAIEDATSGIIRPNKDFPKEITPMRLTKYCAYGYDPDIELLKTVLKTTIKTGFNCNADY